MTAPGSAEIYDRGYRSYDGPRNGIGTAMLSVFVASIQRALGLRRKFRFKVIPILTIFIAYVPALAFIGIAVLLPNELADEVVAEYAGYFGLLSLAVILFTSFVAPELLATDRRTGLFGLYLASPLNRANYLVAKGAALVSVLFLVTLFPVIFLLLGYIFVDLGPGGFFATLEVLGQIVAGGLIMSVYFTLIGMAASTLTTRQGFASAGIVMLLIASGVFSGVLVDVAEAPDWVQLFNISGVPFDVVARVFGEEAEQLDGVSTWSSFAMWLGVCALCVAIIGWGYRRMQVTK